MRKEADNSEIMHFIESEKTQDKDLKNMNAINERSKEYLNKILAKWNSTMD